MPSLHGLNYEEHGELFRPSQLVCRQTQAAASLADPAFIPASQLRLAAGGRA